MNEEHHLALASIQFSSALGPDEIWSPLNHHVDGLHPRAVAEITRAVRAAVARPRSTPTGLVLSGERGVGKTHMLGWLRQHVQDSGGAFFMPKLIDGKSFWAGAVHGVVSQLLGADGGQLGHMLGVLAERSGCGDELRMRLRGTLPVTRAHLDEFLERVEDLDVQVIQQCQDTLRALVLYQAKGALREIGHSFLVLADGIEDTERLAWGFRERNCVPQLIFQHLSRLFALTGPVVLAIDQIDSVIAQSDEIDEDSLANRLADGLMSMREETTRTIIVAACIPKSWELVKTRAVNSAADRFTVLELSTKLPGVEVATAIIEGHLGSLYGEIGFTPPYPTWPVSPVAFQDPDIADFTPRRLLQRVEEHVRDCLAADEVTELTDFQTVSGDRGVAVVPAARELSDLDAEFARLRAAADTVSPFDPQHEDEQMFTLLNAALTVYAVEQRLDGFDFTVDRAATMRPALHARLRRTLDEASEAEEHWSFRAIGHPHHRAVLTRLRSAGLEAGLHERAPKRHLVVLRNTPFSGGPVTKATLTEFEAAHGVAVPLCEDDVRTFAALTAMSTAAAPGFLNWLAVRRPASRSRLLSEVLGRVALSRNRTEDRVQLRSKVPVPPVVAPTAGVDGDTDPAAREIQPVTAPAVGMNGDTGSAVPVVPPAITPSVGVDGDTGSAERPVPPAIAPPAGVGGNTDSGALVVPSPIAPPINGSTDGDGAASVLLGHRTGTGAPFTVPLVLLRKHTAVFAGSGSGKTVLLRRLVEEAAIHGVSSILIDSNNDLARLGDPWPAPPQGWSPGDVARADQYFAGTDVVVWTPRREAGRPLALNPLPDFSGVLDDPDEFRTSIDASVAGLVPRSGLTTRRIATGKAVLTEALTHFAKRGGSDLGEFVTLLGDLPEGISTIRDAHRLAEGMAEELKAAMINDPVFGGAGVRLDPGMLLTPAPGKRARVSVISCIGLPTDEQRQTFVNQLQLALFAWIKRHPAGDRPLGGLLVLDEAQTFVPARGSTASTESTLKLATQARKYGLGMVYATQAPKALHNLVTGNAATQFFGLLNAPVQIQAAAELARAKGGRIDDVARLPAGSFYGATEGAGFGKLGTPMCLTHHPPSALTEDEVLRRARPDEN
ncbi:helicase HerA domain-containing protein [Nocardia sp. NPDC058176]|uniref:helicase HerA domain-containing protein n=1 Tax=Nocardia sp. NPDC058176 TaxID=3346368 RepID=UPI0036D91071